MATIRGGDIRQLKIGGREFGVASGASIEVTLSGYQNTFVPFGNGQMGGTQVRVLAAIDGMEVSIDNDNEDMEFLQGIQTDGEPVPLSYTLVDGKTYSGSLGIDGELKYKSDAGTATFAMRGPKLEQI